MCNFADFEQVKNFLLTLNMSNGYFTVYEQVIIILLTLNKSIGYFTWLWTSHTYFDDLEQVKKLSSYFADFEQVKKINKETPLGETWCLWLGASCHRHSTLASQTC